MLSVGKEVRSSPGVAGMLRDRCGRDAAGQVLMVKDLLCVGGGPGWGKGGWVERWLKR